MRLCILKNSYESDDTITITNNTITLTSEDDIITLIPENNIIVLGENQYCGLALSAFQTSVTR